MTKSHVSRVRELYKLILRLHRNLPDDLKFLGDNYAKEEFRRHKKCKPQEAQIFLNEWRDYALSMSRQSGAARAERHAADEERAGPSREVRADVGGQEEAAALPAPQPAALAVPEPAAAAVVPRPRYGLDLPPMRIVHLSPEQLCNLYMLHVNARRDDPNDPVDRGIELVHADMFAKKIAEAKSYMIQVDKEEKEKLARGEIRFEDLTFQTEWWLQLFDEAVSLKDKEELKRAIEDAERAEEEAKKAKLDAEIAEAKAKEANDALADAEAVGGATMDNKTAMDAAEDAAKEAEKARALAIKAIEISKIAAIDSEVYTAMQNDKKSKFDK